MTLRGQLSVALAAALVLGLSAACTGERGSDSAPVAAPSLSSPEPAKHSVSAETPFAVEGRDYRVAATVPSTLDGRLLSIAGVASDGTEFLTKQSESSDVPVTDDPRGSALVTRAPGTGKMREVSRHGTSGRWLQIAGITVADNKAVWIETPSTSLYELPWEMYTYDLTTGEEKHLASSDFFGIDNPPQPWLEGIVPMIEGDFVYFPAVDEVRKSDPYGRGRGGVYRVPLTGGDPELVAKGAIEVFSDLDGMLQMRFPKRIAQWDPSKGLDGEVANTSLPAVYGSFANEGVRATFNVPEGIRIQRPGRDDIVIEIESEAAVYYLNATSRWVSFTVDSKGNQRGYIYDLERDVLLRLKGVVNTSSHRMRGNLYHLRANWRDEPPAAYALIELLPAN